jgi:molybdopterin-guanine dinucleotide biosynthesis protein A
LSSPSRAEGFVLAGGQSSRMGSDKALLNFNGAPLIQHALGILQTAGLEARIAGARSDLSTIAPVVADEPTSSGLGPMAGICAALDKANTEFAVFLPVDLPLVPANLITYIVHHAIATQSAITLVSEAGFQQTFPVVIDRTAAPALQASLSSDNHGCLTSFRAAVKILRQSLSVLPVELLLAAGHVFHPQGIAAHTWFHNVNSPRDLVYAEGLVGSGASQMESSIRPLRVS